MKNNKIRLTKAQHDKLLNQHVGTGFVCYKEASDTTALIYFYTDKNGQIRTMDGGLLDVGAELTQVVMNDYANDAMNGEIIKVGKNQIYYDKDNLELPFVVEVFEFNDEYKGTNTPMYSVLDGFKTFAEAFKAAMNPRLYKDRLTK